MERKKCVIVGDQKSNKTQLIYNYVNGDYTNEYCPSFVDNFSKTTKRENKTFKVQIYDTTCQTEYETLRISTYNHTDVFIVCFNLNDEETLTNAKNNWYPEIMKASPKAKIVLVGIFTNDEINITEDKIDEVKEKIKTTDYVECNLCDKKDVDTVFEKAFNTFSNKDTNNDKPKKKIFSFFHKKKKRQTIENVIESSINNHEIED